MVKTTAFRDAMLNLYARNEDALNIGDAGGLLQSAADGNLHVSLHLTWPGAGVSQATGEAAYTGYARQAVTRDSSGWTDADGVGNSKNVAAITFPEKTAGSDETAHFWGVGSDSSGAGNLQQVGHFGNDPIACIATTDDNIEVGTGHGLSVNDKVMFYNTPNSTFPTGITEGTIYFVITVSSDTITISTTLGGGALDITVNGSALIAKIVPKLIEDGDEPKISASNLVLTED